MPFSFTKYNHRDTAIRLEGLEKKYIVIMSLHACEHVRKKLLFEVVEKTLIRGEGLGTWSPHEYLDSRVLWP